MSIPNQNINDLKEKCEKITKMYNILATKYNSLVADYKKLKSKLANDSREHQIQIDRLKKQIEEYQLIIETQQIENAENTKNIDIEDKIDSESIINLNFLGY